MDNSVKYLNTTANHFEHCDWDYTRLSHIKSIKYESKHDKTNSFLFRLKSVLRWLFGPTPNFIKELEPTLLGRTKNRICIAYFLFIKEKNVPDGVLLNSGGVITEWEETGEYLQLVQPSVGALLADFLKEDPEHPHAKIITAELDRIIERYNERVINGEVDGNRRNV